MVFMKSDGFSVNSITKPSHFQHTVLVWFMVLINFFQWQMDETLKYNNPEKEKIRQIQITGKSTGELITQAMNAKLLPYRCQMLWIE